MTNCLRCKQIAPVESKFCSFCGLQLRNAKVQDQEKSSPKEYGKSISKKIKDVYTKKDARLLVSSERLAQPKKDTISKSTTSTRRYSYNKTKTKTLLQEEIDFNIKPNSASFISYRDDSKFSASFDALEEHDQSLLDARAMIEELELQNSVRLEQSYEKIYSKPGQRFPINRTIYAPLDGPMSLSVNTRNHITMGATQEFEGNENLVNYLNEFPSIDELYRQKLHDTKTAHLRKPVIDGRIQEAFEGESDSKAWYWGKHRSDGYKEEEDEDEDDEGADNKVSNGSFYWGDKLADRISDNLEEEFNENAHIDGKDKGSGVEPVEYNPMLGQKSSEDYVHERPTSSSAKNGPVLIMQLYHKCCETISRVVSQSVLDYRRDYLYTPGALSYLQSLQTQMHETVEYALYTDKEAAEVYRRFQQYWAQLRTDSANTVAALFEKATHVQETFDAKYQDAYDEFQIDQSKILLQLNRPATSNKAMNDLKAAAEKELSSIGDEIQQAQAVEAQVIMEYRSVEFTAIKAINQWKEVFGNLFKKLTRGNQNLRIVILNLAARKIQRAVWRKLFLWDPKIDRPPLPFDPRADEIYVETIKTGGSSSTTSGIRHEKDTSSYYS